MDKELKDRIADNNKEELKSNYEYLRILIFFLATIGSGTMSLGFKAQQSLLEQVSIFVGVIICVLLGFGIRTNTNKIRFHLNELKKLEI